MNVQEYVFLSGSLDESVHELIELNTNMLDLETWFVEHNKSGLQTLMLSTELSSVAQILLLLPAFVTCSAFQLVKEQTAALFRPLLLVYWICGLTNRSN